MVICYDKGKPNVFQELRRGELTAGLMVVVVVVGRARVKAGSLRESILWPKGQVEMNQVGRRACTKAQRENTVHLGNCRRAGMWYVH